MSAQLKPNSFRRQLLLEARAHEMRLAPSEPEARLWRELRCHKLGVQFRRQVVIAGHIVDFFAPSSRLVVEVDGAHHRLRVKADKHRDRRLSALGLRVLRLSACSVHNELDMVVQTVRSALQARSADLHS